MAAADSTRPAENGQDDEDELAQALKNDEALVPKTSVTVGKSADEAAIERLKMQLDSRPRYSWFRTVCFTLLYLTLGVVFNRMLEEKPCESEARLASPTYDEESCTEPWTVIDSLYFSMATMSTVGYGDLSPSGDVSRAFAIVYIFVGVFIVFGRLAQSLRGALMAIEKKMLTVVDSYIVDVQRQIIDELSVDVDGDGEADFTKAMPGYTFWMRGLVCSLLMLLILQLGSAAIYTAVVPDLTFRDAMYHCMVTATTVGYGDVSMSTQEARLWCFFHMLFSVSWLAAFASRVDELRKLREGQLERDRLLLRQLNEELILSLDTDGSGVDLFEFVVGHLIILGAQLCGEPLKWSTVMPFVKRFEAADVDGSGCLTREDLEILVSENQTRVMCAARHALPKKVQHHIEGKFQRISRVHRASSATTSHQLGTHTEDSNWNEETFGQKAETVLDHMRTARQSRRGDISEGKPGSDVSETPSWDSGSATAAAPATSPDREQEPAAPEPALLAEVQQLRRRVAELEEMLRQTMSPLQSIAMCEFKATTLQADAEGEEKVSPGSLCSSLLAACKPKQVPPPHAALEKPALSPTRSAASPRSPLAAEAAESSPAKSVGGGGQGGAERHKRTL
eukprot:TRINITY_DN46082_c0_g1_i1.p1 TRINITY_DN46082_c0_g1~~TRINITY_DN46082_c0_g1_i1.p1  ORF type:complete len:623 (+),score=187.77 TRINITY_DN46082_c0_g1_i1:87-1955(+)